MVEGVRMESVTRRSFFKQAGTVAAMATVVGVGATAPIGLANGVAGAASPKEAPLTLEEQLGSHEDLVVHVKNSRTGELGLFIGNREVILHDRKIAARLVRAAR
jgi:hypothetical protein